MRGPDLRLVIFDFDGTLVDSQHHIVANMAAAFADAGHPCPPREAVLAIVGLSLPEAIATLAPHLPEAETRKLVNHYRERAAADYRSGRDSAPLFPGALEALHRLAAEPRTLLGIATGKARRGLDAALAAHGLSGLFVTTQTADNHPSKPHPAMLEQALAEAGCGPGDAVMIGDTTFDIAMGRAAGMATIGVAWGYHPADALAESGADLLIDGFAALPPALDRLWPTPA